MDLEIVGRHALLFDDDATAAFVNSSDALVEWNSLLIDRYDVRHLLQDPPPPLKRRRHHPSYPTSSETELDQERYLDLPQSSDDHDSSCLLESDNGAEPAVGGGYHTVAFSYGNRNVSTDKQNFAAGLGDSSFLPPFPVPESLLQNLPPTEKVHQIIARTAIFVSQHGGQSEIVLRVKQGDNPTFGFLMPDHHLHAYFRFLVDHVELLNSGADVKPVDEKKEYSANNLTSDVAGGALSLLGSVYGSGEDEDGTLQVVLESREEPGESLVAENATTSYGSEYAESSVGLSGKVAEAPKPSLHAAKEKSPLSKRNRSVTADNSNVTCSKKREGDARGSSGVSMEKPQVSTLPSNSKIEPLILEPPSHIKRMVDKIVEFILKNGKEFEAILIEQDTKTGRFPFLLPSDQYHPYYLNVLQKAQESKFPGKCFAAQYHDTMGNVGGKKGGLSKDDNDVLSKGPSVSDIPFDSERKLKFKMVIGGSKKDAQDLPPKPTQQQCGVSVDAVAAILQAATRGLRNPKDILPKPSVGDSSLGLGRDGGPTSSFGSPSSSRGRSSMQKPIPNGEASASMPIELSRSAGHLEKEGSRTSGVSVAKAIAKTAALAAACEADSSEASLTKEQKQKAERLKRAKMFAAMIKDGAAPHANDLPPRLSAEPPDSVHSGLMDSGHKASKLNDATLLAPDASNLSSGEVDLLGREREGSSVPVDANTSDRSKSERHDYDDDYKERKSRRKYRSRSIRFEEDSNDETDGRDHKHYEKKHRSHHSSSHDKDERKHIKRHSSPDYKESRHRHRHRHHSPSEDERKHRRRSEKRRRHSERKVKPENDVIVEVPVHTLRVDDSGNSVATLDSSKDPQEQSSAFPAGIPSDATVVSDELRAKVRAMLLATM